MTLECNRSTDLQYYKANGFNTVVMGGPNKGEIEALAGCDRLTISPAPELSDDESALLNALDPNAAKSESSTLLMSQRFGGSKIAMQWPQKSWA